MARNLFFLLIIMDTFEYTLMLKCVYKMWGHPFTLFRPLRAELGVDTYRPKDKKCWTLKSHTGPIIIMIIIILILVFPTKTMLHYLHIPILNVIFLSFTDIFNSAQSILRS